MGSEQNDGTSCQPSEPKPCANNCGFWGRSDTMNLCSKCYRDFQMKEQQAALAKAAMEKSLSPKSSPPLDKPRTAVAAVASLSSVEPVVASSPSSESVSASVAQPPPAKGPTRCQSCRKKVGLMGFKCKCGLMFCGTHRYPENHECSFDFKRQGREAIAKANPVVKGDKLERL